MAKDKVHEIMDDPDEINFGCDVLSSTLFQRKYLHESVLCEKDNFQVSHFQTYFLSFFSVDFSFAYKI